MLLMHQNIIILGKTVYVVALLLNVEKIDITDAHNNQAAISSWAAFV